MALSLNPLWVQAGKYTARDERMGLFDAIYDIPGRLHDTDLQVTATSTASMQVNVSPGSAVIPAISSAFSTGKYVGTNTESYTITIPGSDASKARKDLIVMRAYDSELTGTADNLSIEVVKGTPASSPVVPSTPDMAVVLAVITVNANTSVIANANIDMTSTYTAMANRDVYSGVPIFADTTEKDNYKSRYKSATGNTATDLLYYDKEKKQIKFEEDSSHITVLSGVKGYFYPPIAGRPYIEGRELIMQGGTVVAKTNKDGVISITFKKAFPNGVLSMIAVGGDPYAGTYFVYNDNKYGTLSKSKWSFMALKKDTTRLRNNLVRVNWLAIGW
jgi:hypothetical protein